MSAVLSSLPVVSAVNSSSDSWENGGPGRNCLGGACVESRAGDWVIFQSHWSCRASALRQGTSLNTHCPLLPESCVQGHPGISRWRIWLLGSGGPAGWRSISVARGWRVRSNTRQVCFGYRFYYCCRGEGPLQVCGEGCPLKGARISFQGRSWVRALRTPPACRNPSPGPIAMFFCPGAGEPGLRESPAVRVEEAGEEGLSPLA